MEQKLIWGVHSAFGDVQYFTVIEIPWRAADLEGVLPLRLSFVFF
jgi:hypothetical protein